MVRDPQNPDSGTAFRPKSGKSYFSPRFKVDMIRQDGGVEFCARELGILSSALAEITYGFELENYEQQIGANAATVETLLRRLNATLTPVIFPRVG